MISRGADHNAAYTISEPHDGRKGKATTQTIVRRGGGKNQPWVYRRMRREPVFFTVVLVTCPGTVVVGVGSRRSRFQSVDRAAQRTATDSAINQPNDRANWRFFSFSSLHYRSLDADKVNERFGLSEAPGSNY